MLLFFSLLVGGCKKESTQEPEGGLGNVGLDGTTRPDTTDKVGELGGALAVDPCALVLDELRRAPALEGAPLLAQHRVELLGRARGTPVDFVRPPLVSTNPRARPFVKALLESADPAVTIHQILRKTRSDRALRREIFLREGYLYAETPLLGLRLSQILRIDHLFDVPQIEVHRGESVLRAEKQGDTYKNVEGGSDVALLLFDRIRRAENAPSKLLHVDFHSLVEELGARRLSVSRRTEQGWLLSATYEGTTGLFEVPFAVSVDGVSGRAHLRCEQVPSESKSELERTRVREREHRVHFGPLRAAIDRIVALRLPFDEPRTEFGQEDGKLRVAFTQAYREGRETYEFNGDRYYLFDRDGEVRLPEVCVDFITDAFDWATGGSWAKRGAGRQRVKGALHFASFALDNSRSVESLASFALAHPRWFDVLEFSPKERVRFAERSRFFKLVESKIPDFRLGDVLLINGLRDDERYHYHSFFIYELDPLTGAPILLAANAGPPQIRSWEGEMSSAPRRFLVYRLRPRPELYRLAYEQARARPGVPLVLPVEGPLTAALDSHAVEDVLGGAAGGATRAPGSAPDALVE